MPKFYAKLNKKSNARHLSLEQAPLPSGFKGRGKIRSRVSGVKGFLAGTYRDHRDVFDFLLKLAVVVAIVVLIQMEQSRLNDVAGQVSGLQAMAADMSLRLQSLSFETASCRRSLLPLASLTPTN